MPESQNKSAAERRHERNLRRPFSPKVLARAREIASQYRLVLEEEPEVGFVGSSLELPFVFADGPTPDVCVYQTREALTGVVANMLEKGRTPPLSSSANKREEQVNIRLTAGEKLLLEEAARSKGFRGISDFVRNVSLSNL